MVSSGSKGSAVNITQVQACLGQMNVQGGRIPMDWGDRTATEFSEDRHSPAARGFISHSYLEGLTPWEMYCHSMSGREGLIDTAIKTAQTGYTERKLMKFLENVVTCADGTVRDGERIIQFLYGDDGFDAVRVETQRVKPLKGADAAMVAMLREAEHFPVPIHRIVQNMRDIGGVGHTCGTPVHTGNEKLDAFISVHTPIMIPSTRKIFEEEIRSRLDRARVCPYEGVGALAAQSIGERTTQCTLNTFHFAGIGSKNVTMGIPRLDEILRVAKFPKTPVTTVRDRAALKLRHVKIHPLQPQEGDTIGNYWDFPDGGITEEEAFHRWGEPTRMVLELEDIRGIFEYVAYSDTPGRYVCDVYGEIPEEIGVPGAEWCKWIDDHVETTLQDLDKIMEICECDTLYTNDIWKMFQTYGVECARSCLLIELRKILDHYGIYINSRHLTLLIDAMTCEGTLTPLSRHGLKSSKASALKRCTFEEVVTVLHDAALNNEVDLVDGISSCVLTGRVAKLGANAVTVFKDHVVEKKWKIDPPQEEGADTWIPESWMLAPASPTYEP